MHTVQSAWGKESDLVALYESLMLLHIPPQGTHFCFSEGHLAGARHLGLGVKPLQRLQSCMHSEAAPATTSRTMWLPSNKKQVAMVAVVAYMCGSCDQSKPASCATLLWVSYLGSFTPVLAITLCVNQPCAADAGPGLSCCSTSCSIDCST